MNYDIWSFWILYLCFEYIRFAISSFISHFTNCTDTKYCFSKYFQHEVTKRSSVNATSSRLSVNQLVRMTWLLPLCFVNQFWTFKHFSNSQKLFRLCESLNWNFIDFLLIFRTAWSFLHPGSTLRITTLTTPAILTPKMTNCSSRHSRNITTTRAAAGPGPQPGQPPLARCLGPCLSQWSPLSAACSSRISSSWVGSLGDTPVHFFISLVPQNKKIHSEK